MILNQLTKKKGQEINPTVKFDHETYRFFYKV